VVADNFGLVLALAVGLCGPAQEPHKVSPGLLARHSLYLICMCPPCCCCPHPKSSISHLINELVRMLLYPSFGHQARAILSTCVIVPGWRFRFAPAVLYPVLATLDLWVHPAGAAECAPEHSEPGAPGDGSRAMDPPGHHPNAPGRPATPKGCCCHLTLVRPRVAVQHPLPSPGCFSPPMHPSGPSTAPGPMSCQCARCARELPGRF